MHHAAVLTTLAPSPPPLPPPLHPYLGCSSCLECQWYFRRLYSMLETPS
uniref:Uncharacterized protein n=1 Tax=Anguilla anguilla TaxID=7936 RepID=A0A0E9QSL6_ANGAN